MKTGEKCTVPPEGWYCTRRPGHEGPCAALPTVEVKDPYETAFSFRVTKLQAAQAHVWMDKHDNEKHASAMRTGHMGKKFRYAGAIGGAYTWEFTSTSIGTAVSVKCSCGEELNVTDYDSW